MRFGTGIFCALAMLAQPEPAQLTISGDKQWTDTGIDLVAGETLRIEASGTLKYPGKKQGDKAREAGPNGLPKQWLDLVRVMPAPDAGQGALIARLGNRDSARPMLVGARKEILTELCRMNITRASLFPGVDGLAQSLRTRVASPAIGWSPHREKWYVSPAGTDRSRT